MTRLASLRATPHPYGNRIDLSWRHPGAGEFPDLRVVRRTGAFPVAPEPAHPRHGRVVADTRPAPGVGPIAVGADGVWRASDAGLRGETVYYYALFPYRGEPPEFEVDSGNRVAAPATAPYGFADLMAELLPAVYHRYDTVTPRPGAPGLAPGDAGRGQLRRFLDLPGSHLDQLYSLARSLLDFHHLDRVDGRLLPLLAEWIGWKTDLRLGFDTQRNEIRHAPALYRAIGLIPTVAATVKRITGWESRTKEFVHNVLVSNRPERLNLWLRRRDGGGGWPRPERPLSLNYAYDGRPAAAADAEGSLWLFFHAFKRRRWEIWFKTRRGGEWSPSRPLDDRASFDRHPAAAAQGETLWVFWEAYDPPSRGRRIDLRTRRAGAWSEIDAAQPFAAGPAERHRPAALVDGDGGLWLFWLERAGGRWTLRYNRHDGAGWQLDPPARLPLAAGEDPRVESDLAVLFHPGDPSQPIWVFWARREATAVPGQTRWTIAYRVKAGLDPADDSDWSALRFPPKADPGDHHREPAARVAADGDLELFWASDRDGSWSIWRSTLDVATHAFGAAEAITAPPFTERGPLPVDDAGDTLLFYRSNESLAYTSEVYRAQRTVDARYAGSTVAHTRNAAKIALRGDFDDIQTYVYDAGRGGARNNDDRYARDTVGLYLEPDTADAAAIAGEVARLAAVLGEFMPLTDRAVFVTEPGDNDD
jgi:hypothetical protein